MLVIRLQRTGRKGYAHYRVVVQDSRRSPSSGKVVALLGHYNPHTKEVVLNKDQISEYLKNGAQPSDRVAILCKKEGIKLPKWVQLPKDQKKATKNTEKLRKNRPVEETKPAEEAPAESSQEPAKEQVAEVPSQEEPTSDSDKVETKQA
jgi:small subunit ribosomal protein S16